MTILRKNYGKKCGRNTEEVLAWLNTDPGIRMRVISQNTNKSQSIIEKVIKKLIEVNIIERVGSRKSGYWKINHEILKNNEF